jgi:hypothetical protein
MPWRTYSLLLMAAGLGACATEDKGLASTPDGDVMVTDGPSVADVPGGAEDLAPAGCDGPACKHQPIGTACASRDDCASGFCADGVCCNVECSGACVTCSQAGRTGQCLPVDAGAEDPHGLCKDQGAGSCGQTGRCSGQGSCARYAAGTSCKPSECTGGSMTPAGTCDGRGTCLSGPAISCEPYMCANASCRQSCDSDVDCVAPATCIGGSCGKRGLGQVCKASDDCKSGFCADGVCCSDACAGVCRYCALASSLGRCVDVPLDSPDPRAALGVTDPARVCLAQAASSCGTNGLCNGAGGCQRFAAGTPCRPESCDAATNTHTGQFTCSSDGRCVPPTARSCAPFTCAGAHCATSCASNADCAGGAICENRSCGRRPTGQLCSLDGDCSSGNCEQGVCCASACTGACFSCALPGSAGVCVAVPAGGADPSGTCRDQGQASCQNDGSCNGSGGCRRYASGVVCAPATCTAGQATAARTCDGLGACGAGASRSCAPYLCNAAVADCFNSCSANTQCTAGNLCLMNQCGKKSNGAPCTQGSECTTNVCADGVCCNVACGAACQTCALPGAIGTCSPVPSGLSDSDGSCGPVCTADGTSAQDRRCDGAGACEPLGAPAACGAYVCKAGSCPGSCSTNADCTTGNTCAGMACGPPMKKANGASCLAAADCISNNCVDRTCCGSVSCATCQTCANPAGTCLPALPGTSCGPTSCSADNRSAITPQCTALGMCGAGTPISCGNYVCSNSACKTSCSNDADCAVGRCRGFRCR